MQKGRKLKTPCRGRTMRKCGRAIKSCEFTKSRIKGRRYCRTRRNKR